LAASRLATDLPTPSKISTVVYKKLDSTLRGNVAAELSAAYSTIGKREAA
jgi:uncharacterized protein YgbK (DUF1537 family)